MGFKQENGFHSGDRAVVVVKGIYPPVYAPRSVILTAATRDGDKVTYFFEEKSTGTTQPTVVAVPSSSVFDNFPDAEAHAKKLNQSAKVFLNHAGISETAENKIKSLIEAIQGVELQVDHGIREIWYRDASGKTETELRLTFLPERRLTVSRVCFEKKNIGTMSAVLKLLLGACNEEKYPVLCIQSVLTREMADFCLNHGFKPDKTVCFPLSDGFITGDYLLEIQESTIPSLLTNRRKIQKRTQAEIAEAVGISRRQYQRYENGERDLMESPYWLVNAILKELNIQETELAMLTRGDAYERNHLDTPHG